MRKLGINNLRKISTNLLLSGYGVWIKNCMVMIKIVRLTKFKEYNFV